MRPSNQSARDQLLSVLGRMPRASAAELAVALQVSQSTLQRLLAELPPGSWVKAGSSRRTRYARRRALRGTLADIPLYVVDDSGGISQVSQLALLHPEGSLLPMNAPVRSARDTADNSLAGNEWPVPDEARDGWWEGLPYPLYDMRPQGFIGRQLAHAEHQKLAVSPNPDEWNDDDIVHVLSHAGSDVSGNLLLGDEAFRRWQQGKLDPLPVEARAQLGEHYLHRAEQVLRGGSVTSSAGGEFPKFTALREGGKTTPHVLVKFSGAGQSAAERRWADLLVCEHLALEFVRTLPGLASAHTRILRHEGRTFLEAERFDRVGLHGRIALSSLESLSHAFIGSGSTEWPVLVSQLHRQGIVADEVVRHVELAWWFGRLIANSDMHLGNLSFHPASQMRLAPLYDMLPMAYAPLPGGEVPPRDFHPTLPLPPQREVWNAACAAAIDFWDRAAKDVRISQAFQAVCAANQRRLLDVAARL